MSHLIYNANLQIQEFFSYATTVKNENLEF